MVTAEEGFMDLARKTETFNHLVQQRADEMMRCVFRPSWVANSSFDTSIRATTESVLWVSGGFPT
jgi:hypothetical protein